MNRFTAAFLVVWGLLLFPVSAGAQPGPPFFGEGTAFDPEVSIINSGALLDAQAVVSPDRKYVTINTRVTNTELLGLTQFPVQTLGFVGGANPGGGGGTGGGGGGAGGVGSGGGGARGTVGGGGSAAGTTVNGINASPTAIANQNSILNREGMFLLVALE